MDPDLDDFNAFETFDYTDEVLDALEKKFLNLSESSTPHGAKTPAAVATTRQVTPVDIEPTRIASPLSLEELQSESETARDGVEQATVDASCPTSRAPAATMAAERLRDERAPTKHGRGHPKGSKNRKTLEKLAKQTAASTDEEPCQEKRPVGRPRGSGPKQLMASSEGAEGGERRRVGRPRKPYPMFGAAKPGPSSTNQGLRVLGLPAVGPSHRRGTASVPADLCASLPQPSSIPAATANIGVSSSTLDPHGAPAAPFQMDEVLPEPEHALVPETDPSQIVDDVMCSDDEDDETRLMEDGLGEDDNEDDGEDDDEDFGGDARGEHRQGLLPRHPLPTWLQDVFDFYVEQSDPKRRSRNELPPLYRDHKTFWFPRPSNYFFLRDSQVPSPQKLYEYSFFLWDPMALLPEGIPCPNAGCKGRLWRHSHVPRPRRVVDINKSFWIIGYRYRCSCCIKPNSVTFRSWDSRILAVLPRALAAEFPARLTYRSGMALGALAFMRSCFQHGMGAKQFSNALRVQHLQNYDRVHLQYLHTLATRPLSAHSDSKFKAFLSFDDRSPDGLHGFVPSGQWFRDIYDQFIEEHKDDFNQHTAMLTAKICAIDHSFKLTKHVAKVDGVQVFTALLTITNEKGEMRICNLVATKSHSQFILALQRMHRSLELYGHDQPFLFFTDGMNDKDFLEKCFPSLQLDLVPVEKYSHLAPLQIPDSVNVSVKNTVTSINDAMRTILELLPEDDAPDTITVGLDAEWNVEVSERGYVTGRRQTAILQISHGTNIYILQIGHMLAGHELPSLLKQVLTNPRIQKVGCGVTADLKYLQQACQSSSVFVGGINLGMFAKDRFAVKSARVGLAELCAIVLGKRLNKNIPERVSTAWEDDELTPAQLCYAALDAHASLEIYSALLKIPIPTPLPQDIRAGMSVLLFNNDRTRLLARGMISSHAYDETFSGINITSLRCVVEVQEVLVPGAIISNGTSHRKPLEEYGKPPFHMVCLRSHLRQSTSASMANAISAANDVINPDHCEHTRTANIPSAVDMEDYSYDPGSLPDGSEEDESTRIGNVLLQTLQSDTPHVTPCAQDHASDPTSQDECEAILHETKTAWVPHIRSCVLKDPFHVFNMFYISAAHGLLREFAIALRDAIFIPHQADKARIITWGQSQSPPKPWNDMLFKHASWLWRRCKRIIPPAEELYPLVAKVFQTYGPLKDAKSGLPLFNTTAWGVAKNVLELIRKGHLSDPPGIPLYYQVGIDSKTGLPLYRCMRGTNMTEGGVHTHLRSRLPTSGVSVRHVQSCLLDFILRHNLLVGTYNTTGRRYTGHYSIWITNELQEMLCLIQPMLIQPQMITNWVNGNLYQRSDEVAGVLPIPSEIRSKSGMGPYIATLHAKQTHGFLASMQGTRKPVLPIHNSEERDLFRELMSSNTGFNNSIAGGTNCDHAVQLWNNKADMKGSISYKLNEQLKVYYNGDWKRNTNIKQTKAMTAEVRVPLKNSLRDPQRSLDAPPVPQSCRVPATAPLGLLPPPPIHSTPPASLPLLRQPSTSEGAGSSSAPYAIPAADEQAIFELARKRASNSIPKPPAKKCQHRTCRKCAQPACPGSQKVQNCKNKCRDCGKVNCRGRNSGRPNLTCQKGWDV